MHDVTQQKYYAIDFDSMQQAGKDAIDMSKYRAVIDSGTSITIGPSDLIDELLDGISIPLTCKGIEDLPDLTFTFNGVDYVLTYEDYVLKVTSGGVTECEAAIQGTNFGPLFKYMIFGDNFMRRFNTFFDKKNNQVGFAKAY